MPEVVAPDALPSRIGGRYDIHELLGRGGMAVVYRATDSVAGREVALKQLTVVPAAKDASAVIALFEREFHTLAQLSHPRIIEVYDYGVDAAGAYYTMELLEGGDLRERSPLPWREACTLLYDVCSSLALIHSRRLVHRDVGPRNIRCTRDGRAKLIDFGAMVPVGQAGMIVGTPLFVAPEVVHRSAQDGRTDLFSLGATMYFALTGRAAYPARHFSQLPEVWRTKPPPPSRFADSIPKALDGLVLSMLDLEPAMRPHTAFEVMQRLAAIAGIEHAEVDGVSRAYLTTPVMVGRREQASILRHLMRAAVGGAGKSVLIDGARGLGRSRMLDACVLDAKILGGTVVRASATGSGGDGFAIVQALAEQLLAALPDVAWASATPHVRGTLFEQDGEPSEPRLRDLTSAAVPRLTSQAALMEWFFDVSAARPIAIVVDDVDRIDEASLAVLSALASQVTRHRVLLVVTAEQGAKGRALEVLAKHSAHLTLPALTRDQTEELFRSVFGDVPNLRPMSDGIHALSGGIPRACLDLAEHLVDTGKILYEAGAWTLPASLDPASLPSTAEDAILTRIGALSPFSRFLAEAQALASHLTFTREDYGRLCADKDPRLIDPGITELVSQRLLVTDGRYYTLSHRGWVSALTAPLSEEELVARHLALVGVYEPKAGVAAVHHLLLAGLPVRALDKLGEVLGAAADGFALQIASQLPTLEIALILERALFAARTLGRTPREMHELRRWIVSMSVACDEKLYWHAAPDWLEQLKADSGLNLWSEITDAPDETERRSRALGLAYQRYGASAESERVYRPDEAIRHLVQYVVVSIAVGSRTLNSALLKTLPALLEPLAPLSPAIEAIWQNSIATGEARCYAQPERARTRWIDLHARLSKMTAAELPFVEVIKQAMASGIGLVSAQMGLASASDWAELLEQDILQRITALYLRKVVSLQQGDWAAAERYRRDAEVLALQAHSLQMFASSLITELDAHAFASDLTGLKQVMDRIEPLAERSSGWLAYLHLGEGRFRKICGDLVAAEATFQQVLALAPPDAGDPAPAFGVWAQATAGYVETLVGLGRVEEARAMGEEALLTCQKLGIGVMSHDIARALALAETKLGSYDVAVERLDRIAREQLELGVTGLHLGATYEARSRIAIWMGDEPAIQKFGPLTAEEYRHGTGSPLGARYERLMDEARQVLAVTLPKLSAFESTRMADAPGEQAGVWLAVTQTLMGATDAKDRGERALGLLCKDRGATVGQLYLVGESGLTHVASNDGTAPPDGLDQYLTDYLTNELENEECATATVSGEDAFVPENRGSFVDVAGSRHHPVLLVATTDGVTRYAAIAALVDAKGDGQAIGAPLAAVIGAHLLSAGDTRGLSPSD